MDINQGKLHWRYQPLENIGQGGYGKVLLVRDILSGKKLALKVANASGISSLRNEFIRLHRSNHPGLPAVYDFHQTAQSAALSQEYCSGDSLAAKLSKGSLPENEAFAVLNKLAVILAYIHQRGFIHGDLKPENIILDGAAVKLLDLGLARKAGSSMTGITAGTPAYASPELLSGQGIITQASDIYSLGLLLFEMLSGKLPPPEKRLSKNEPLIADIREMISGPGADIPMKMLRYDPIERLGSAGDLLMAGREMEIFQDQEFLSGFDYIAPQDDLRAIVSLCNKSNEGLINLTGDQGSGKTRFLKELNFINQLKGRCSYYFDAEDLSGIAATEFKFEPGSILFADNARESGDLLKKLARDKRCNIFCTGLDDAADRPSGLESVTLSPVAEQGYQRMLKICFNGINNYDLRLLSLWLLRQAGNDMWRAEKLVGHLTRSGLIGQSGRIWHVRWPDILKDNRLPIEIINKLENWWQNLSNADKRRAIDISLGKIPSDQDIGIGLRYKSVKEGERWMIRDDQVLALVTGKWGKEDFDEFVRTLDGLNDSIGQFFNRDIYKGLLAEKENWDNWIKVTVLLYRKAEMEKNIYSTLSLAQDLIDSGNIAPDLYNELVVKITDSYCQLGQWEKALETWEKLENRFGNDLKYWKRFFYVSVTGRFLDAAERKIGDITGGKIIANEDIVAMAKAYGGYVKGIKGDFPSGKKIIQGCIDQCAKKKNDYLLKSSYELMAQLSYQNSCWGEVIDYIDKSRQYVCDEENYDLMLNDFIYGIALWMTSNLTGARDAIMETMSQADPDVPNQLLVKMYYSLGAILFDLKDWKGAIEAYQNSIYHGLATSETRSLKNSKYGLASVSIKQGRFDQAYKIYYELYHHGSNDKETGVSVGYLTTLGILENMLGRTELSLERIDKAIEINRLQKSPYPEETILNAKAGIELEQGKYELALATFAEALAEYQDKAMIPDPEIYADLSYAEYKISNIEKAKEWLKMAKDAPDKNPVLVSRIKGVEGMINMADESTRLEGSRMAVLTGKEMLENGDKFYAANCWLQTAEEAVKYQDNELLRELMPWLLKAESEFIEMGTPDYLERARETIIKASRIYFGKSGKSAVPVELLKGIYQLAETLSTEGSQSSLAQSALKLAVEMSGAERGALFLLDDQLKISLAAQIDIDDQTKSDALEFSTSAVLTSAGQGDVIISNDASVDKAFSSRLSVQRNVIRSLLCAPIRFREGAAGAIYLDSRITTGLFGKEQKEFVMAFAGIIGAVLESSMLIGKLKAKSDDAESRAEDITSLIIGQSPPMKQTMERIKAIAKADINVLLDGESGSGKEVAAQAIHKLSERRGQKFLALDCGSLPETLLESELFGYVKGSFTGATKDKTGLFESADGGTVFLDEIASASQAVQSRLLRVLENGEIRRVGESESRTVDVRVICATNKDLEIEINEGRFRADLYYRLKVVTIPIPPLRERGNDILLLAEFFKDKYQRKFGKIGLRFNSEAKYQMMNFSWPGNVRELENTVQKAVLLANTKIISVKELEITPDLETVKVKKQLDQKQEVLEAIKNHDGNVTQAAKTMGFSRRHFYRLLEKYQIKA